MHESPNIAAKLHQSVGEAMDTYARVEAHLADIVGNLLKVDYRRSHIIFFAVSNMRSRLDLIENLFSLHLKGAHQEAFRAYWASVERYLTTLSHFRNALAHWHPNINIYISRLGAQDRPPRYVAALAHPVPGFNQKTIEERHIRDFIDDCQFAREFLSAIKPPAKRRPSSLPRIFRRPITRRNKADLQPPQNPKAQRTPSKPKVSRAERRRRAMKAAARTAS